MTRVLVTIRGRLLNLVGAYHPLCRRSAGRAAAAMDDLHIDKAEPRKYSAFPSAGFRKNSSSLKTSKQFSGPSRSRHITSTACL